MLKKFLRVALGQETIDRIKHLGGRSQLAWTRFINRSRGVRYINLGAGTDAERIGWWAGDVQTGFIFDETTHLPQLDSSIEFAYSSMFFEHLNDETAANLLNETWRVLKWGKCLRIVVPNFSEYIRRYHAKDWNFFYSEKNPNLLTWKRYGVPVDLEHLFVGMISSIHNLPHTIVPYLHLEDLRAVPARVYHPFQERFEGYYCGPAPELTTDEIKRWANGPEDEFLKWVFDKTNSSSLQDPTFNSWHKNAWDLQKMTVFGKAAGFSTIEESAYGTFGHPVDSTFEKPQHAVLGRYFNLYKPDRPHSAFTPARCGTHAAGDARSSPDGTTAIHNDVLAGHV